MKILCPQIKIRFYWKVKVKKKQFLWFVLLDWSYRYANVIAENTGKIRTYSYTYTTQHLCEPPTRC